MTTVSVLAAAVTIAMFISQLSIITELRRAQRTRASVPILQFLVSFLSSVLWLKYGMLKTDQTIIFVNTIGTIVATYILACFWWYSAKPRYVESRFLLTVVCGLLSIGYVDHSSDPWAMDAFSLVCCLMSLVFLGSPLSQIGNVIRLRDASVLLPSVASLAFANNVLWSVYGYLHNDAFMLFPNAIGTALCALQLGLIGYYGRAAANLPLTAIVKDEEGVPMTEISA
ncbi:Sugar transporter [Coemansia sp. RSA 2681]|nr:Sugar transporter [Coemansia sp. RSA 2681]KAJ2439326.1 Sugar transporter [Coemansia sp. RSA 2424]KAJ2506545.1 Sugar transporter [Coemansia sp. RSA 2052]